MQMGWFFRLVLAGGWADVWQLLAWLADLISIVWRSWVEAQTLVTKGGARTCRCLEAQLIQQVRALGWGTEVVAGADEEKGVGGEHERPRVLLLPAQQGFHQFVQRQPRPCARARETNAIDQQQLCTELAA